MNLFILVLFFFFFLHHNSLAFEAEPGIECVDFLYPLNFIVDIPSQLAWGYFIKR